MRKFVYPKRVHDRDEVSCEAVFTYTNRLEVVDMQHSTTQKNEGRC